MIGVILGQIGRKVSKVTDYVMFPSVPYPPTERTAITRAASAPHFPCVPAGAAFDRYR